MPRVGVWGHPRENFETLHQNLIPACVLGAFESLGATTSISHSMVIAHKMHLT